MITCDSVRPLEYNAPFRCAQASVQDLPNDLRTKVVAATKRGAVLYGPVGTGKTFAMCVARRLTMTDAADGSLFVDWPEFISDIERFADMRTPDRDRFDPERRLFFWRGPLFVDDVGAEQMVGSGYKAGRSEAVFDQFVNRRTGVNFPLWITTNLTPTELRERYGERTLSRLVEHCTMIPVSGADRRLAS